MTGPHDERSPPPDALTGEHDQTPPAYDQTAGGSPNATDGPPADEGTPASPAPTKWPVYPKADPIGALSYIVSGVLIWGLLGWGAARWLGAPVLTGLGLVIGGALGTVLVYLRYGRPQSGHTSEMNPAQRPTPRVAQPSAEPAPRRPEEKQ